MKWRPPTWADDVRERAHPNREYAVVREPGVGYVRMLDREIDVYPPPCCARRRIAADVLVYVGTLPAPVLDLVRGRFPHLASIADGDLYLCDGCRETLVREQVITREGMARGFGAPADIVAKAWRHDELFYHRGPDSAPAEARAQAWWPEYEDVMRTADPRQCRGLLGEVVRRWAS